MIASNAIPLMMKELLVHNRLPSRVSNVNFTKSNAGISIAPDIIALMNIFPPSLGI